MVSPREPEQRLGLYWGFAAAQAPTFSEVFRALGPRCVKVLVDGDSAAPFSAELRSAIAARVCDGGAEQVFLFFAGRGLRHLFDHDERTKANYGRLRARFDFEFRPLSDRFGLKNFHLDEQIGFYLHEIFNVFDS